MCHSSYFKTSLCSLANGIPLGRSSFCFVSGQLSIAIRSTNISLLNTAVHAVHIWGGPLLNVCCRAITSGDILCPGQTARELIGEKYLNVVYYSFVGKHDCIALGFGCSIQYCTIDLAVDHNLYLPTYQHSQTCTYANSHTILTID